MVVDRPGHVGRTADHANTGRGRPVTGDEEQVAANVEKEDNPEASKAGRVLQRNLILRSDPVQAPEAAGLLGLTSGAAVSTQLRRLEEDLAVDRTLARKMRQIEGVLGGLRQKAAGR